MANLIQQFEARLLGARDAFDYGPAGVILTADYFEAEASGGAVTADLTATVPSPTLTANAAILITASLTATVPSPTLTSAVALSVPERTADLIADVPVPTLTANAQVIIGASLTAAVPTPTSGGSASILIQVSLSADVPVPTLNSEVTITYPMGAELTATVPAPTLVSYTEITTGAPAIPARVPARPLYTNRYGQLRDPSARKYALLNRRA